MIERDQTLSGLNKHLDDLTLSVSAMADLLQDSDRPFFSEFEALVCYLASVLSSMDSKLDDLATRDSNE